MKKILSNGVTVVTEKINYLRSVSLGIWVLGGSCADGENSGIAHYCEHMAFKGTSNKNAQAIAQEFDAMGGDVNAFTAKEVTCFYAKMLDTHLYKGLELLGDMVLNPSYNLSETENERKVILEEISMYEDSPDDLSLGRLCENVWHGSPLGKEILGTQESVNKITSNLLRQNLQTKYTGENIFISACGNFDEVEFAAKCEEIFSKTAKGKKTEITYNTKYNKSIILIDKPIEQNHICIGFEGIKMHDPRRYHQSIFASVLGGSMSSRLFQSVRENQGLAYNVFSQFSSYCDGGLFSIYTALNPKSQDKALSLIRKELDEIKKNGITAEELNRAKEQLEAAVIIDLEGTSSRMKLLAKNELFGSRETDADSIIKKIKEVTLTDVQDFAKDIIDYDKASISVVGKTENKEYYKGFFE